MLAASARSAQLTERLELKLPAVGALLDGYFNHQGEVVAPPTLLTGHEVMRALNMRPGPAVGEILDRVREAQAAGEVRNKEDALDLARRINAQE
jgi:tRNA nucleotidyltransferase (CCA-adding enzyme)